MLEICALVKNFTHPDTEVLHKINLTVRAGEFVVVIGPSGSGKTTLIRCINRLTDPTAGEIFFEGQPTSQLRGAKLRALRTQIGMIFQDYNLIYRSNVMQNVLHGRLGQMGFFRSALGLYSRQDLREARELLVAVGLEEFTHNKAQSLSGGQMQRVGICRAMMQNPKLLLADEPISSLDPASAKVVLDQIKALTQARGLTSIINLHQVDFAKAYASRIVGLRLGEIVFDGVPEDLTQEMTDYIYAR
ncbi:MAG: phosphonate ABC transporter ATP-binding protein [Defluviitaleaceae bacterium]|nr:phosphonate ABC transporter ATP-binding protein [Defluviitaleaceae bacterium]MCL2203812.1 phosphonate ABC transporter ATP-binding protein [Defluviitaleaceae bacterium]MCL2239281.1 phosphonate ABC transporter ATP-binding protein [Defluviitaleaceae bacterium]